MATVGRKKETCWKPKIQILAAEKIFLLWRGKKSTSGEFFLFQEKVFRVLDHFVN